MKDKKSILKIVSLCFTTVFLCGMVFQVKAASVDTILNLSKKEAVELALENNNDLKRLETGLDILNRKFNKYKTLSIEAEKAEDDFKEYKRAYETINSESFKTLQGTLTNILKLDECINGIKDLTSKIEVLQSKGELSETENAQLQVLINGLDAYKSGANQIIEGLLGMLSNPDKLKGLSSYGLSVDPNIIQQIISSGATPEQLMSNPTFMGLINNFIKVAKEKAPELNAKVVKFEKAKKQVIASDLADSTTGEPKVLSKKEEYETFIMPQKIPWYTVQCMIEKVSKQKETANETVDVKVKEAYENLLYAKEGYNLKNQLLQRMLKGYNDLTNSNKLGMSSDTQKKILEIEINKSKLDLDNLSKDIQNGEFQFKKALGINISTQIALIDSLDKTIIETKSYETYLQNALGNRMEIYNANIDLEEKKRTIDIIKEYFSEEEYGLMNAQKELDEADVDLSDAKKNVEENIQRAYLDVIQKRKEIDLASQNIDKSQQQLDSAKKAYEIGTSQISLIWDAELGLNKSQMDYNTSLRNYNISLYKLEKASKLGPAY